MVDGTPVAERLRFVRQFSSAQDVQRAHPILDRTADIIAGPKTGGTPVDVLETPYAVTTDSAHRVFVTDVAAGKVHVFDFANSKYFVLQDEAEHSHRPVGVAADPEGNLYVTDSGSGAVSIYDSRGKFRRFLKEPRGRESYFEAPWGIAIDPATERVYVCDALRNMVIVLDKKGHVLDRFGKRGGGKRAGEFRYPTQIVASGGEIAVLDSGNQRIQILDPRGRCLREIKLDYADNRSGMAVDSDGSIYVSDGVMNRIQVYSRDGHSLGAFGKVGTKPGEFNVPSGLWADSGRLYVVDAQNKRIQVFLTREQNKSATP